MQKSYIFLNEVRFHAFHGVMPQERAVGADFLVSLRVGYDISRAMGSDDVADTFNNAEVYEIVKREMGIPSNLLEHVAGRMAKCIQEVFPTLTSIDIKITKTNPPMGAACSGAGVELHIEM